MGARERVMEKMEWIVYKHTCPTGEVYIGITNRKPQDRWLNGEGYNGAWFYDAVCEFGWNNIQHEILFTGLSKAEAEAKEAELIDSLHSWCPGVGYNDLLGVGRKRGLPIRDPSSHKVYPTIRHACDDVGHDTYWVRRRMILCNRENAQANDIYMPT